MQGDINSKLVSAENLVVYVSKDTGNLWCDFIIIQKEIK